MRARQIPLSVDEARPRHQAAAADCALHVHEIEPYQGGNWHYIEESVRERLPLIFAERSDGEETIQVLAGGAQVANVSGALAQRIRSAFAARQPVYARLLRARRDTDEGCRVWMSLEIGDPPDEPAAATVQP